MALHGEQTVRLGRDRAIGVGDAGGVGDVGREVAHAFDLVRLIDTRRATQATAAVTDEPLTTCQVPSPPSVATSSKIRALERDGFQELASYARPGDTLTVCELYRLCRDLADILEVRKWCEQHGVKLRVLSGALSGITDLAAESVREQPATEGRMKTGQGASEAMQPHATRPTCRRVVTTGSGGLVSSTHSPNRRMCSVNYGEMVARSSGSTGCPSSTNWLTTAVMSRVVW